jgi:omega-amidase
LKISIVQTNICWEDKTANLSHIEELLSEITSSDLIVLPELFSTGFSMSVENLSEPMNLHTTKWMQQLAQQKKSIITGSIIIKDAGKYYNRLLWVQPDGVINTYDKKHLFRMGEENTYFTPGIKKSFFKYNSRSFVPFICYDLRFPVWMRNNGNDCDCIVVVANWPASRSNAWRTLLTARAIENQCFVIGVNRVGIDANNLVYSGDSLIIDPKGELIIDAKDNEGVFSTVLKMDELDQFREKFPAGLDADSFLFI